MIPRYSGTRTFQGVEFRDAGWPGPPALDAAVAPDEPLRNALRERIAEAWSRAGGAIP